MLTNTVLDDCMTVAACSNTQRMDRSLPKATPALAKSVWHNQKRPSARSVARAMTAAGYPVHFTTVARWKRHGWADTDGVHPLDQARAALDSIAPLLTGDPMTNADDLTEDADDNLDGPSDAEHLSRVARELSLTFIRVANAIRLSVASLVASRPNELADLIDALVACGKAANAATLQAERLERGPTKEGLALEDWPGLRHRGASALRTNMRPEADKFQRQS